MLSLAMIGAGVGLFLYQISKIDTSSEVTEKYNMTVKNKRYQALFYQLPDMEKVDTLAFAEQAKLEMLKKYTPAQLESPTEEILLEIKSTTMRMAMELLAKKPVWFVISEHYGQYYITMYYDNEYNHSNGEDL